MKRLNSGNNALGPRGSQTIVVPNRRAQVANRLLLLLIVVPVVVFMVWALVVNLTSPLPSPLPDGEGVMVSTPAVSDFVLLQDARVDDTAERLELEREQERVAAELEQISLQIEQADQQQQLGLLREQQRLELERQQIGNLIAQWDAERQRLLNDATANAQAIELAAQAEAAGEVARAEAAERTAEASKRLAEAAQAQALADAVGVAALGLAVVVVIAGALPLLAAALAGSWVLFSVARQQAQMRLALPAPQPSQPAPSVADAFFENAPTPVREAEPVAPRPEVNTVITRNYGLLSEYLTARQIGLLPDLTPDDVPEWAAEAMLSMVADGHSRTLVSTLFGLTGRHYSTFRQLLDGVGVS